MSYQVLARKWRPGTFEQVVGQQHVLQALSNALTHQRLHHAYLLTGTRGVGKTTIARILSKSLNCIQGISAQPCGECEACLQIEEGRFVDLMEIDAASRTKVEDTREILDNVQYRPTVGRYKVYLIDEVHMLSRHSFNALLKTLEEPPPHVIFLLATTDPDKLPVTVLSRCLQFNLRSLTREEITGQLANILQQESIPFDEPALGLLARAAQGSMRDALSLTDQAIAQGNNEVRTDTVEQMLGRIDPHNMLALISAIAGGKVDDSLDQLRTLIDKMPDISDALTEMQNILHQLALAQVAPEYLDSELVAHKEAFGALSQQLSPEEVQVYYRIVLEGRREIPFAPDAFSGVEMTVLRMLSFRPSEKKNDQVRDVAIPFEGDTDEAPENMPEPAESEPLSAESETPISPEFESSSAQRDAKTDAEEKESEAVASMLATRDNLRKKVRDNDLESASSQPVKPESNASSAPQDAPDNADLEPSPVQQDAAPDSVESEPLSEQPDPTHLEPAVDTSAEIQETEHFEGSTDGIREAAQIDSWSASIAGLNIGGRIRQVLLHSNLNKLEQGYELVIDAQQQAMCNDRMMEQLQADLQVLIGNKPLQINFGNPDATPFQIQQDIDAKRLNAAKQKLNDHEGFQKLQQALGGSVKNITPE